MSPPYRVRHTLHASRCSRRSLAPTGVLQGFSQAPIPLSDLHISSKAPGVSASVHALTSSPTTFSCSKSPEERHKWPCDGPFDMQRITLEELKHVLYHAFRDHLTMKDIENIIVNEEESLNETAGNCQTEFEGAAAETGARHGHGHGHGHSHVRIVSLWRRIGSWALLPSATFLHLLFSRPGSHNFVKIRYWGRGVPATEERNSDFHQGALVCRVNSSSLPWPLACHPHAFRSTGMLWGKEDADLNAGLLFQPLGSSSANVNGQPRSPRSRDLEHRYWSLEAKSVPWPYTSNPVPPVSQQSTGDMGQAPSGVLATCAVLMSVLRRQVGAACCPLCGSCGRAGPGTWEPGAQVTVEVSAPSTSSVGGGSRKAQGHLLERFGGSDLGL
ncbi:hypothetical protein CB1_001241013 [Camelus ferus]|nr:hypothetical protein CB1_001241013 [Camelus ferus]